MKRRDPKIFDINHSADFKENQKAAHKKWEEIKKNEKKRTSILDGVPDSLPALSYAQKIFEKSQTLGLTDEEIVIKKVTPETDEELGSIILNLVFWAAENGYEAERALRAANKRFVTFIQNIETAATDKNIDLFSADSKTRKILKSEIENQTLKEL